MNRVRGGKKAKSYGKAFELAVYEQCQREGLFPIWHPDGCETIARPPYLIRTKMPFDFSILKDSKALFLDAKSFDKNTMSASDMAEHQVRILARAEEEGFAAGYLVYFRKPDKIVFFDAHVLLELGEKGGSIKWEDGLLCGHIQNFKIRLIAFLG